MRVSKKNVECVRILLCTENIDFKTYKEKCYEKAAGNDEIINMLRKYETNQTGNEQSKKKRKKRDNPGEKKNRTVRFVCFFFLML